MLQANSHTRLHFQAQTSLCFHKEPGCYGVSTVTSRNECDANEGRWAELSKSLSSEPQEPRSVPSFERRARKRSVPSFERRARKRSLRSEPRTFGWESSSGTAGSGHGSTLSQGQPGLHWLLPPSLPCTGPARGDGEAPRGSQNGPWLWGGRGSGDPDTQGHPLLLFPPREPLPAPGTCWAQLPGLAFV